MICMWLRDWFMFRPIIQSLLYRQSVSLDLFLVFKEKCRYNDFLVTLFTEM